MFNEIKEELTRKICELRLWLSNINDSDDFSAINKGLFYVYIYGIYEETVRTVVQKTIEELNAKSVKIDECIYCLLYTSSIGYRCRILRRMFAGTRIVAIWRNPA